MGTKSAFNAATDAAENLKNVQESQGFSEIEKLAETVGLKKHTDKVLAVKDTTSTAFGEQKECLAEITDDIKKEKKEEPKKKPLWKKITTGVVVGAIGAFAGKELLGGKKKTDETVDAVVETTDEAFEIINDEERLKEVNDTMEKSGKTYQDIQIVKKDLEIKHNLKRDTSEFWEKAKKYTEKNEGTGKKYGWKSLISEGWKSAEFKYDEEGNVTEKRGFFSRILVAFGIGGGLLKEWKTFQKLEKTGALATLKKTKEKKEEIEVKYKEVKGQVDEAMETKQDVIKPFREVPGIITLSKIYLKQLMGLMNDANKYKPEQIATKIKDISTNTASASMKFGKTMTTQPLELKKYFPGISLKMRGGFMVVEVLGKAMGDALRAGAKGYGFGTAMGAFKDTLMSSETWKDAIPIWGTIRSFQKIGKDDGRKKWSKWAEAGFSLALDAATVISLGTLSGAAIAARTGIFALGKATTKAVVVNQVRKASTRAVETASIESITGQAGKTLGKNVVKASGGKMALKLNLMLTTINQFFSKDEVQGVITEMKSEALTPEQRRTLRNYKKFENGDFSEEQESVFAEADKKRKEEIEHDEEKRSAGVLAETSLADEDEEGIPSSIVKSKQRDEEEEPQTLFGKAKKIVKEEIVNKVTTS